MKIIQFNVKFENVIAFEQTSWENTKKQTTFKIETSTLSPNLGKIA